MFKKLFSKNKEESIAEVSKVNWIRLTTVDQIKKVKEVSKKGYVGIFKHSTRCGISKSVIKRFEENFPEDSKVTMFYIDLLNYREVSSEVGFEFQVMHQSPQLLLIKDGNAVGHASHYSILEMKLNNL